jgi:hypothetical protein
MPDALDKKPGAFLGFVDLVLQQACGGYVARLVTKRMHLTHVSCQRRIVIPKLG